MRVLYFGTPQFSADILSALLNDKDIDVVGVVCQNDEVIGRKKILTAPPTKELALKHGIPVFQPIKLRDEMFLTSIDLLHADVAVIVAYGRILPKALLERIPKGFVNVHPSLLPKYRGPSPMQAAIRAGDEVTGVSIMTINEGMDTGPLLAQIEIDLAKNETTASLTDKVVRVAAPLLLHSLKGYMNGTIVPKEQRTEGISICKLLSREDGKIDWNTDAQTIEQTIRAFTPWPGTWTLWNVRGEECTIKILTAAISDVVETDSHTIGVPTIESGKLVVPCKDSTLEILTLQPAGGKPMTGADFARGHLKQ